MSIDKLVETVNILNRPNLSKRVQTALLLDARDLIDVLIGNISPGSQLQPPLFERVKSAFHDGWEQYLPGKLTAIRCYKTMTGCSLKDAKDAVEKMMENNHWK